MAADTAAVPISYIVNIREFERDLRVLEHPSVQYNPGRFLPLIRKVELVVRAPGLPSRCGLLLARRPVDVLMLRHR